MLPARRLLIAALLLQAAGNALLLIGLGLDEALARLTAPDIALVTVVLGAVASALLLLPVWRGQRWAMAASVPLFGVLLAAGLAAFGATFTAPSMVGFASWLIVAAVLVGAAAGLLFATAAYFEAKARPSSAGGAAAAGTTSVAIFAAVAAVGALIGMTALAVAVAASPASPAPGVGQPTAQVVTLVMRDLRFEPAELILPAGVTTTVEIVNEDTYEHSFDIDELGVHVLVGGGASERVQLAPAAGDRLRLYCAIGGHVELGMVGQVVGH